MGDGRGVMCVDNIISPTKTKKKLRIRKHKTEQECIPVGCVPPAAVAVGGVCLSACWDPPWVWTWRPPPPPGMGLETPPGQTPQLGPGDLQGMLGYHHPPWRPATRHAGIPSPCEQNHRHV